MFKSFAVCCSLILLFSANICAEMLEVRDGYVRGLPPTQRVTAAFMELVNHGSETLRLSGAQTPSAERVEIHSHVHDEGVMRMRRVDAVDIPGGGQFIFQPGSYHLMLIGLQQSLREGDEVELVLLLDNAEPVAVRLPVRSVLSEGRGSHHHHGGGN